MDALHAKSTNYIRTFSSVTDLLCTVHVHVDDDAERDTYLHLYSAVARASCGLFASNDGDLLLIKRLRRISN